MSSEDSMKALAGSGGGAAPGTQLRTLVTPKMAQGWLTLQHPRQGIRYREDLAARYATLMKRGEWRADSLIVLADNGWLLDGQHRLRAVVLSGIPQEFVVVDDADPGDYKNFDAGQGRSLAFRAEMGTTEAAMIAFILNLAGWGREGKDGKPVFGLSKQKLSPVALQLGMETFGDSFANFDKLCGRSFLKGITSAPMRVAVMLRMRKHHHKAAEIGAAYRALITLDLRNAPRMLSSFYRRVKDETFSQVDGFALSWNAFNPASWELTKVQVRSVESIIRSVQKEFGLDDLYDATRDNIIPAPEGE
jgi:hypothetical protein